MPLENIFNMRVFFGCICIAFLFLSLMSRLAVLFGNTPLFIGVIGVGGGLVSLTIFFKRKWLKYILFCFALTFPLYGSLSYSYHSFLFELYLTFIALICFLSAIGKPHNIAINRYLVFLLFSYIFLSTFSLLLLPVNDFIWKAVLWNNDVFWNAVYFSTPEQPLYSIRSISILFVFGFFIVALSMYENSKELYRYLFLGLLTGAIWAAVIGILDYYNVIDLLWYRAIAGEGIRLRSVFANPGWFAEYMAVTMPFILLGFISPRLTKAKKILLCVPLVICEVAIILTYSRTGWFIYPIVLLACWIFYYGSTHLENEFYSWQKISSIATKVIISIPLTILISYFLVFYAFTSQRSEIVQEREKFSKRVSELTNPIKRKTIWEESFNIVKEKPFWGLGYESYKFQNLMLEKTKEEWDTPHNFYLQLLVSGGIVGLTLWSVLIGVTLYLLAADLVRNKTFFNIAVAMSIVAFHLYGLTQSMQYIPVIWVLVFLNIGYGMTIDEDIIPKRLRSISTGIAFLFIGVLLTGLIIYAKDFQSQALASKLGLRQYSPDQQGDRYFGFYAPEEWSEKTVFRWTGSSAAIQLPFGKIYEFTYVCSAPDLSEDPLFLFVYANRKLIDKITFAIPESKKRRYYLFKDKDSDEELRFSVSRTWNLRKLSEGSDMRNLGVAISEPKVLEEFPEEGMGFYNWERWDQDAVPGLGAHFPYRWTGVQAVFDPRKLNRHGVVYLRAGQPGLPHEPLRIDIVQEGHIIATTQLDDTVWHKLNFKDNLRSSKPCTISVSRTWVPQKMGVAEDFRVLGVAVAGISPESPP